MKNKKTFTLTLIGLFIFLFGVIGITYAYWQLTLKQTDENLVYTDCLKLATTLTETGRFTLDDAYPMTNDELVKDFFPNQIPYHFTIENKCDNEIPISINMESLNESELKDDYVDVILWEGSENELMQQGTTKVLSYEGSSKESKYKLIDNKENKSMIAENAKKAYQLYNFKLEGGTTKQFNLLLFMDYATPVSTEENPTNNVSWSGKITLNNYEAKTTLIDTILALDKKTDNSGETGLYKVTHENASITYTGDLISIANLQKDEYRYAGSDPDNYVSFGEKVEQDQYELFICESDMCMNAQEYASESYFSTKEACENEKNNIERMYEEGISQGVISVKCNQTMIAGTPIYWRIIGLVNTPEGQRVKLVRDTSIGKFSWDASGSNVNNGYGVNEWSESDLMKLLNPEYEENKNQICIENGDTYEITCNDDIDLVNNSLYWNGGIGKCYVDEGNVTSDCDFTNHKIPDSLKEMIESVTWTTGSGVENDTVEGIVSKFYEYERSSNIGKICENDSSYDGCNDIIDRSTSWVGKVGLIYPSDYGYATSGGNVTNREDCLNMPIATWNSNEENIDDSNCYKDNWLNASSWMLSPKAQRMLDRDFSDASSAYLIAEYSVMAIYASDKVDVRPSVFLSTNVLVVSGDGSKENAYILETP